MKRITLGALVLALTVVFPLSVGAREGRGHSASVRLAGVISVPNNPIISSDISWVDPRTERVYITDRSNFGVDIIDAENNVYVGRVTGMAGPLPSGGGPATPTEPRPHGVLRVPPRDPWAAV